MEEKELIIYKKYSNLYYYAYKLLAKYPKTERFGLTSDIKNSMNRVIQYMFYAQKVRASKKLDYLNKIDAELLYQRFAIRLSFNLKYISSNNYTTWSNKIAEIGKMLGGWIKSCPKE